MSNFEKIDENKYKITFSVDGAKFKEGLDHSFSKNQKHFKVDGFRKGKIPRALVEKTYGVEVLYDDAFNFLLGDAYPEAVVTSELEIVSKPEIDVLSASKEDGVVFTAIVYTKPSVSVSEYKGLSCEKMEVSVSEEDVNNQLNAELEKHSKVEKVTDRAVEDGDLANIDFEGFVDGVAFEGGKGEGYDLEIGSKTFIDTFEEQLIGKNINDEVDVNVTFPEAYGKEELASKPALFKVKINEINRKALPELNDEFATDTTEFNSLEEYKNSIKEKLASAKEQEVKNKKQDQVVDSLVEKVEVSIPQPMLELEIDNSIQEFERGLRGQGLDLQTYLNYMGQSIENMREAYQLICEKQIKVRLALEEIVKIENFEVPEEEVTEELQRICDMYKIDFSKADEIFGGAEKENVKKDLRMKKALEFIVENAVEA